MAGSKPMRFSNKMLCHCMLAEATQTPKNAALLQPILSISA
jgi:hypothetical protein